jgi:N-acetylglucosamine-6-phosphate deacetylase
VARILLRNARLLDPEAPEPKAASLLLDEGRIVARLGADAQAAGDAVVIDLEGLHLAPGFIDLHWHGSLVFADTTGLADALREASRNRVREGVTAFLPTTLAWPAAALAGFVASVAWTLGTERWPGAEPLGIHLEGPWISPQACGAQPREGIRPVDLGEVRTLLDRAGGTVRMVTLAPEVSGADALLEELARRGVVPALGHSLADAQGVERAIAAGARHVTHLFNAMGPLHHRAPGLAGCALADERLSFDLICDGVHVDSNVLKIAFRAQRERAMLITDRVELPSGGASFGSGALLDDGTAIRLPDGRLAGSALTLDRALRNACRLAGASLLEAVAACTLRPARLLGLESERGTLRPGARADLVLLDADAHVVETWIGGECVHALA